MSDSKSGKFFVYIFSLIFFFIYFFYFILAGRWTQEEHQLFLKGLQLYNRQWRLIADLVKTRTVVQIRTHAQKYFMKMQKENKSDKVSKRNLKQIFFFSNSIYFLVSSSKTR